MRATTTMSTLALAAFTLALIAAPAFAASPYYDAMGMPMTADQADMTYNGMMHPEMMDAQPRMRGQYTCSPMEKRTRLQRKACGATKSMY